MPVGTTEQQVEVTAERTLSSFHNTSSLKEQTKIDCESEKQRHLNPGFAPETWRFVNTKLLFLPFPRLAFGTVQRSCLAWPLQPQPHSLSDNVWFFPPVRFHPTLQLFEQMAIAAYQILGISQIFVEAERSAKINSPNFEILSDQDVSQIWIRIIHN